MCPCEGPGRCFGFAVRGACNTGRRDREGGCALVNPACAHPGATTAGQPGLGCGSGSPWGTMGPIRCPALAAPGRPGREPLQQGLCWEQLGAGWCGVMGTSPGVPGGGGALPQARAVPPRQAALHKSLGPVGVKAQLIHKVIGAFRGARPAQPSACGSGVPDPCDRVLHRGAPRTWGGGGECGTDEVRGPLWRGARLEGIGVLPPAEGSMGGGGSLQFVCACVCVCAHMCACVGIRDP